MSSEHRLALTYSIRGRTRTVELEPASSIIGRSPSCDLEIPLESISRKHAEISFKNGSWFVTDLGAKNGVALNGKPIGQRQPWPLCQGDVVSLGSVELSCGFRGASLPATFPREVLFDEGEMAGTRTEVIDMDEFRTVLADNLRTSTNRSKTKDREPLRAERRSSSVQDIGRIASLFYEAANGLLSCPDLESILENILELVFNNLPAQRGIICLYEKDKGRLEHKVARTTDGASREPLRISRTIADAAIQAEQAMLVRDTADDEDYKKAESIVMMNIRSAMCAPLSSEEGVGGLIYVDTEDSRHTFTNAHLEVLSTLAVFSAVAVEQTRLKEKVLREQAIRRKLARYSNPAVIDRILNAGSNTVGQMIADEVTVSVIFADISGFTAMSEQMSPTEVTRVLNGIFEKLTRAVFEFEGTLDKFIGDEVMAFFGAPLPQADHAERAVRAALRMMECLVEYNAENPHQAALDMSIGINSGDVVVGDIGSPERKDYTVIGDTVNTAKRIEANFATSGQIAIGSTTYELVKDLFDLEVQAPLQPKGKGVELTTYLVRCPK